jgi:hypothetical protein
MSERDRDSMNQAEEISLLLGEFEDKEIEDEMRPMFPDTFHGRINLDTFSNTSERTPERKRKRSLSPPPHQGSKDTEELRVQKKKESTKRETKINNLPFIRNTSSSCWVLYFLNYVILMPFVVKNVVHVMISKSNAYKK